MPGKLKIRRALLSVTDKTGLEKLAEAMIQTGAELVASGGTAQYLREHGIPSTPIEKITGNPEAFGGRMKTLSFSVFGGILYRRGNAEDEEDLQKHGYPPVDAVVVNFYPFEKNPTIENIDIGGPSLVRAAAKNSPSTLVLTSSLQYDKVIQELKSTGGILEETSQRCASEAWDMVLAYDSAIAAQFGARGGELRYGENPHQKAKLRIDADPPIDWAKPLTGNEISYNNVLDLSAAYGVASDLVRWSTAEKLPGTGVVIVKHNGPCGVAWVPDRFQKRRADLQMRALELAWAGDPVSAFGGVVVFTDPIEEEVAGRLSEKFIELVAAPRLTEESPAMGILGAKRKKLKALGILRFREEPLWGEMRIPGGKLLQETDLMVEEPLRSVTDETWDSSDDALARFGILITKALKSNAITVVRRTSEEGAFQLVGAGQGQPNRVEALSKLALPRAVSVLKESGGEMADCVLVSDAFFPFRDSVDETAAAGIKKIVQPGGSIKDDEVIEACREHGVRMVFTGYRHFRH